MRRALARARRGDALDVAEAEILLQARGADLEPLCGIAARVRDAGLEAAGRPGVITYSKKVFIPLTRLCRDKCHYCTFVTVPGKLRSEGHGMFLSPDEVLDIARKGAALGCKEALFTLGDKPEDRWPEAREWLDAHGYDDTLAYVRAMAIRVLEETGLLPHLNPGVLSWTDLQRLKPVAPSMGMMLETVATRLWSKPGGPHHGSPDKEPAVRLRVLEDAGAAQRPVHHRPAHRHRRGLRRARRGPVRDPPRRPAVPGDPRGHHPELPRQAGHGDARHARRRAARTGRGRRRRPADPRPGRAHPGAAEPGRPRVRAADRRGHRRLGRRLPAHPGPRQPGASVAAHRGAGRAHRRRRIRAARAAHRLPRIPQARRAVARPPAAPACQGPGRPGDRPGERGGDPGRPALAGDRGPRRLRPHRSARDHRHDRPHRRPPRRLRRGLRQLGRAALPGHAHRRPATPGLRRARRR